MFIVTVFGWTTVERLPVGPFTKGVKERHIIIEFTQLGKVRYNALTSIGTLPNGGQTVFKGGAYYANWDILMAWFAEGPYEVAIVGKEFEARRKELDRHYLSNVILSGGKNEGTLSLL